MSEEKDTGGPAYPVADPFLVHSPQTVSEAKRLASGMSLRDYFAAHAMAAWLQGVDAPSEGKCAKFAYEMAEAMLAARDAA